VNLSVGARRPVLVGGAAVFAAALAVVLAAFLLLRGGSTAQAFELVENPGEPNGAGQQLFITNESVELTFVSVKAGYNNEFGRWSPLPEESFFFCKNVPVGYTVSGGRHTGPV